MRNESNSIQVYEGYQWKWKTQHCWISKTVTFNTRIKKHTESSSHKLNTSHKLDIWSILAFKCISQTWYVIHIGSQIHPTNLIYDPYWPLNASHKLDIWSILALMYILQLIYDSYWPSNTSHKLDIWSILALKYIPKRRSKNISPNCTDDKQFSSVIYNQNKTKTKQYVEGVIRPIETVKISPNFYYVYLKHGIP